MLGGKSPELAVTGRRLMALMLESKLLRAEVGIEGHAGTRPAGTVAAVNIRIPASLKFTVPLILLGFVAALAAVNVFYHVPQAEKAERGRQPQPPRPGNVADAEHARIPALEGRPRDGAARDRGAGAQP
jgi:hypothetical protein